MTVNIKFIGALRKASGKSKTSISYTPGLTVKSLILKIAEETPEVKTDILEMQADGNLKTSALILVNDREISVLKGLETPLSDGDEVVFVPVVHGG